jgi:hypothetical protein
MRTPANITKMSAEAAQTASVPSPHWLVCDERRFGDALALAERCAR